MPRWIPKPIWKGEDAYIIGGGPSLQTFDWNLLKGRNTIGCNGAFSLGPDICKVVLFGDMKFWKKEGIREQLAACGCAVATCNPQLLNAEEPWLCTLPRIPRGLTVKPELGLGWGFNTGSAAVNLALLMGARRVFLLGFDMGLQEGKSNWHTIGTDKPREAVYKRFLDGFDYVHRDLARFYPGCEVLNVTDGTSRLTVFPKVSIEKHFATVSQDKEL